jgi:hypothetical protein
MNFRGCFSGFVRPGNGQNQEKQWVLTKFHVGQRPEKREGERLEISTTEFLGVYGGKNRVFSAGKQEASN